MACWLASPAARSKTSSFGASANSHPTTFALFRRGRRWLGRWSQQTIRVSRFSAQVRTPGLSRAGTNSARKLADLNDVEFEVLLSDLVSMDILGNWYELWSIGSMGPLDRLILTDFGSAMVQYMRDSTSG